MEFMRANIVFFGLRIFAKVSALLTFNAYSAAAHVARQRRNRAIRLVLAASRKYTSRPATSKLKAQGRETMQGSSNSCALHPFRVACFPGCQTERSVNGTRICRLAVAPEALLQALFVGTISTAN